MRETALASRPIVEALFNAYIISLEMDSYVSGFTDSAVFAFHYGDAPTFKWLIECMGLCDIDEKLMKDVAEESNADFFTKDFNELINRPEVSAVVLMR
jgi:predicted dehydrogenase